MAAEIEASIARSPSRSRRSAAFAARSPITSAGSKPCRASNPWVKLTRDYDTQQLAYRELLTKSTAAQVAANLEDQDIGERFRIVHPRWSRYSRWSRTPPVQRHRIGRWPAARPGRRRVARIPRQELLDRGPRPRRTCRCRRWRPCRTWPRPPSESGRASVDRRLDRAAPRAWHSPATSPGICSCGTAYGEGARWAN